MSFSTKYTFTIQQDNTLAQEKQWQTIVMFEPGTVPATPTAPAITTGPLGSSGQATATYTHGDGTAAGYANPVDSVQRALVLLENDASLNGI